MIVRAGMRWLMAAFYLAAGILHLRDPAGFLAIVPNWVPAPREVVLLTGLAEISGAIGLMIPRLRRAAGIGLALYALCVFPANIKHAVEGLVIPGMPSGWWYHAPRLAFQPVLIWWALFCAGVIDWPMKKRHARAQRSGDPRIS